MVDSGHDKISRMMLLPPVIFLGQYTDLWSSEYCSVNKVTCQTLATFLWVNYLHFTMYHSSVVCLQNCWYNLRLQPLFLSLLITTMQQLFTRQYSTSILRQNMKRITALYQTVLLLLLIFWYELLALAFILSPCFAVTAYHFFSKYQNDKKEKADSVSEIEVCIVLGSAFNEWCKLIN